MSADLLISIGIGAGVRCDYKVCLSVVKVVP